MRRTEAAKLLSTAELALFDAAHGDALAALDARQLKSRVARARDLRDKYRDLYRRQQLATRARNGSKRGTANPSNQRTARKADLFAEVLARLQARLKQATREEGVAAARNSEAHPSRRAGRRAPSRTAGAPRRPRRNPATAAPAPSAQKPARAAAARSPKAPARAPGSTPAAPPLAAGFQSARAKDVDTRRQLHASRGKVIHAHLRARGRRSQARRDRRG